MYFPSSSCSSSSSSSVYPSSQGSSTTSSSSHSHRGYRQPSLISRPSLNHPTPVSLSSLRDLTATSSTYNPPSPSSSPSISTWSSPTHSTSPTTATADSLETLNLSSSSSRPIPIPKPVSTADLPVTPLTGRFEKGYYFAPQQTDQSPPSVRKSSSHKNLQNFDPHGRHRHSHHRRHHHPHSHNLHHHRQHHHQSVPSMRSDNSNFYSPIMSSAMPPSGRPASPQSSRSRAQNTTKSVPSFHLSNLPRFHPTVYPSTSSQTTVGQQQQQQQSQPPLQSRHHTYRQSSGSSSRDGMRQLMEGVASSRVPSGQYSPSPSAPRLDPLLSPGPVTPLVLEEGNSYLASGASGATDPFSRDPPNSGSASDKIAREGDRAWQKSSILNAKGR